MALAGDVRVIPVARLARAGYFPMAVTTRVLIVDDLAANQLLLERVLVLLEAEPTVASSGAEALAMLATASFELVLMDVQMPEMDGLETTRRIRSEFGDAVRIVALSGFAGDEAMRACREAGMDGYLAKPLTIPAIAAVLAEYRASQRDHLDTQSADLDEDAADVNSDDGPAGEPAGAREAQWRQTTAGGPVWW